MTNNPNPIIVPCHRVIKSNGLIGGYALGIKKKMSVLKNEGITIKKGEIVNYEKYIYLF